jgi:hypothetical protein
MTTVNNAADYSQQGAAHCKIIAHEKIAPLILSGVVFRYDYCSQKFRFFACILTQP